MQAQVPLQAQVRVRLLGPVRAFDGERELDLGGPMSRALVARLALESPGLVGSATLIDDLWDDNLPADASAALQSIVSRTRRRLPPQALLGAPGGYRLDADVDIATFHRLLATGRSRQAVELWHGPPLADLPDLPFARRLAPGLEAARLAALEQALDQELSDHPPDGPLLAELAELTAAHPYRDGLWALHLRALALAGHRAQALAAYETYRRRLADDLGTDPSPLVADLHLQILRSPDTAGRSPATRVAEIAPDRSPRVTPSLRPAGSEAMDDATNDDGAGAGTTGTRPAGGGPAGGGPAGGARGQDRLPAPLTSFVGREEDLRILGRALEGHRLVTLLGPGGAGKTRLAVETARSLADRTANLWFVDLAAVTAAADVVPAVLSAMGLLEVSVLDRPATPSSMRAAARLFEQVADIDGLLVLDNCEHVIEAAAAAAEEVLTHGPRLRVLATSREGLQLIGEFGYPVGPLGLPDPAAGPDGASAATAVRLFVERARAVDQTFVLDESTLPPVIEICRRLDGQPLAIELAAARLRTLAVGEIAERLSDRFRLLTGGTRTLARHRTLRAVVEWSWDLLDDAERDLAERVAVFPAGVTPDGAAAVTRADARPDARADARADAGSDARAGDLLDLLTEKSLLVADRAAHRYRMLETLREYGIERLSDRGLLTQVRTAHLGYALELAERLRVEMQGPGQVGAIRAMGDERANMTAAARFAAERGDRSGAGRILVAMMFYFAIRNENDEMRALIELVRSAPGEAEPAIEIVLAGIALADRAADPSRLDEAGQSPLVERIVRLWDAHRPDDDMALLVLTALQLFGLIGDRVIPEPGDRWTRSVLCLLRLAVAENAGRAERLDELAEQAIEGFRACGDSWGLAASLGIRGGLAASAGATEAARRDWCESVVLLERLGADQDASLCRLRLLGLEVATADDDALDALHTRLAAQARSAPDPAAGSPDRAGRFAHALTRLSLAQVDHARGDDAAAADILAGLLRTPLGIDPLDGVQLEAALRAAYAVALAGCGRAGEAEEEITIAVGLGRRVHDMPILANLIAAAAVLARQVRRDDARAVRLLGAADRIRGRADHANRDARALADTLRTALGSDAFDALFAQGLALDVDDAAALALPCLPGPSGGPGPAGT